MINLVFVKKCCKDYTKIENYEEAANDTTQTWICHHILGEILSREQLEAHDFYYNVPSCMLKFVTWSEHTRIHGKARTGIKNPLYGKHHACSEETKKKISKANKGKIRSEEQCKNISESLKGRTLSEEHKRHIGLASKGRKLKSPSAETRRKMSEARKRYLAKKRGEI